MIMPGGMIMPPTSSADSLILIQFAGASIPMASASNENPAESDKLRQGRIRLHIVMTVFRRSPLVIVMMPAMVMAVILPCERIENSN